MSKFRYGRLAAVASSALLALMLLGPTAVSASTPGWFFTISGGCVTDSVSCPNTPPAPFDPTPPTLNPDLVKVGANAGWSVRITNGGTSNISALYLSTDLSTKSTLSYPTYIGSKDSTGTFIPGLATYGGGASGPASPCADAGTGPLFCNFGSLPAGGWVQIDVIAFTVASPNFCRDASNTPTCYGFNFQAFGNGNTPSDKGGKSHGDTLNAPVGVVPTTSGDYGGGFAINTDPVSNDLLSRNNLQSETVTPPASLIPVAIQDGLLCTDTWCSSGFGDLMKLNVNAGAPFTNGIKLVITISGKSVPGGTTTSSIYLVHLLDPIDGGTTQTITQRCDGSTTLDAVPGGAECITVTRVGNNFQIVAYLISNGQIRLF